MNHLSILLFVSACVGRFASTIYDRSRTNYIAPRHFICILLLGSFGTTGHANEGAVTDVESVYSSGAATYQERCVLCHGKQGFGLGLLPSSVKDYPNTNLHTIKHGSSLEEIERSIMLGGKMSHIDDRMPPWDDELSKSQITALAKYVKLILEDPTRAYRYQKGLESNQRTSDTIGKNAFKRYCVQCHGATGEGDGRMAKIIKTPPPANLATSMMPDIYLKEIIRKGGSAMGRSPQMPPWGEELTEQQLDSVVRYINLLRKETLKSNE